MLRSWASSAQKKQKEDSCAQVRFATGGGWLPATNLELIASAKPGSAAPTLSRAFDATRETNGLFDSKRRQAAKSATQEGNDNAEVVESGERTIDQLIAGVPTPQELGRREARQLRQQVKAAEENSRCECSNGRLGRVTVADSLTADRCCEQDDLHPDGDACALAIALG